MKPDSMLVDPDYLLQARQDIATSGVAEALQALADTEPGCGGAD